MPAHRPAAFLHTSALFSTLLSLLIGTLVTSPAFAQATPPAQVARLVNEAIASPAETAKTMHELRSRGYRSVTVEAWNDGFTEYPSEVLKRSAGVDRHPALAGAEPRDLLQETLIEAHRNGLLYFARFGPGPSKEFMLDLMLEVARKYDIDGIQVDERLLESAAPGFFADAIHARHPRMLVTSGSVTPSAYPPDWRKPAVALVPMPPANMSATSENRWRIIDLPRGRYRLIGFDGANWDYLSDVRQDVAVGVNLRQYMFASARYKQVEIIPDRRADMRRAPR